MQAMPIEWMMVGSLGLVVIVQQLHRGVGAATAIVWLVALALFGGSALYEGKQVFFLGIRVPNWLFAGFSVGLISYNVRVFVRWYVAMKAASAPVAEPTEVPATAPAEDASASVR